MHIANFSADLDRHAAAFLGLIKQHIINLRVVASEKLLVSLYKRFNSVDGPEMQLLTRVCRYKACYEFV